MSKVWMITGSASGLGRDIAEVGIGLDGQREPSIHAEPALSRIARTMTAMR